MFKLISAILIASSISLCACTATNYDKDLVPDVAPENLYNTAKTAMASGNYAVARQYLEALDTRYPFGAISEQVQLDLIYTYYKNRDPEMTSAQINRYIRLNPTSEYMDYILYMKGLNHIQKRSSIVQDWLGLDRSQKDPTEYLAALNTFKQLINTYPDSPYVHDAYQRCIYIRNELAKREFAIASYYKERGALLSSIRHCQTIIYAYRGTEYIEPALALMKDNYKELGLDEASINSDTIYKANYNN